MMGPLVEQRAARPRHTHDSLRWPLTARCDNRESALCSGARGRLYQRLRLTAQCEQERQPVRAIARRTPGARPRPGGLRLP